MMNSQAVFSKLRHALATLYSDEADMKRVASDAGLVLSEIAFASKAINSWQAILDTAIKTNRLETLLTVARNEYSQYEPLRDAWDDYQQFVAHGGRFELTAELDTALYQQQAGHNQPSNKNTENALPQQITIGSGDFVGRDQLIQGNKIQAHVEPGAQNTVVGNTIIQVIGNTLNIPPVLVKFMMIAIGVIVLIALVVLVVLLFTMKDNKETAAKTSQIAREMERANYTPTPAPTPTHIPMNGSTYNVVVAQIENGYENGQDPYIGKNLSDMLAKILINEFAKFQAEQNDRVIQVRSDGPSTAGEAEKDYPIGVVTKPVEAETMRKALNADLLIYGKLSADQPPKLTLEFVHKKGGADVDLDLTYQFLQTEFTINNPDESQVELANNQELLCHVKIIAWQIRGLAEDLGGNHAKALEIFMNAERDLAPSCYSHGLEALYYFQGREALELLETPGPYALREEGQTVQILQDQAAHEAISRSPTQRLQRFALAETAMMTATQINPHYIDAYLGLANSYWQRAEFNLSCGQITKQSNNHCTPELATEQLESTGHPFTTTGVLTDSNAAIRFYQLAHSEAQQQSQQMPGNRRLELNRYFAQLMLGHVYVTKGRAYHKLYELTQANTTLDEAIHLLLTTVPFFKADRYYGYLTAAHHQLALADLTLAFIDEEQQAYDRSIGLLTQAKYHYILCSNQPDTKMADDDKVWQVYLKSFCQDRPAKLDAEIARLMQYEVTANHKTN